MKTVVEYKYRFVFSNGYTHDFWFGYLNIERGDTTKIISLEWKHADENTHVRHNPAHLTLSAIDAIIDLGESREVQVDV